MDTMRFAATALSGYRLRTLLILIAMTIGVAAVIVLTALGEGARRYVTNEFSSLGTYLLIVLPGRAETTGAAPATFAGQTPRSLTLDDAIALTRLRSVKLAAPLNIGSASVAWQHKTREVPILGTNADMLSIRRWQMALGHFLPVADMDQASPVCVIGAKLRRELFGKQSPIGEWLRIGDRRFRIIGVLATEGRSIGVDVEDIVIVPVASAQSLFNTDSLFRIMVEAKSRDAIQAVQQDILKLLEDRHRGERDITVITQDAVLATFDRIFRALTYTVAGIGAISLGVAGILIMNVMLVAISQRRNEIGLLKALGASRRQILMIFLTEAGLLSLGGALTGVTLGYLGSWGLGAAYPALQGGAPVWAILSAASVALISGLLFAATPARRASQLEPIDALAKR